MLESELRSALSRNGFPPEIVEKVLASLREKKLVNDSKAINNLVAQRTGKRAAGIEKMRSELLARNAPEELIEKELSAVSQDSQREGMRQLLRARCKPGDSRAKGVRLLLSRGFDEDAIVGALDEFFGAEDFPE